MTNNTLFCGIALVVIGLFSFFVESPTWDKRVNQYLDAHDKAVEEYPAKKAEKPDTPEPNPNKKLADLGADAKEQKLRKDPVKQNFTALIPAGIGAALLLLVGVVVYKPDARKHAMHLGAAVGLAAVAGGLYALSGGVADYNLLAGWGGPSLGEEWPKIVNDPTGKVGLWDQPKVRSGGLTALVGAIYVGLAVKSFIDARKARAVGTPAG